MKRRDFLKTLSAVPAIAAVPVLAKNSTGNEFSDWDSVVQAGKVMDKQSISIAKGKNNFDPDFTQKMAKMFMDGFEKQRVADNKYHAYIDNKEIPIESVIQNDVIRTPPMEKGQTFTLKSPFMNMRKG